MLRFFDFCQTLLIIIMSGHPTNNQPVEGKIMALYQGEFKGRQGTMQIKIEKEGGWGSGNAVYKTGTFGMGRTKLFDWVGGDLQAQIRSHFGDQQGTLNPLFRSWQQTRVLTIELYGQTQYGISATGNPYEYWLLKNCARRFHYFVN